MIKFNLTNSMIGNRYPFFLNNQRLQDSYYLYEICSPSLSPDCVPYLSLHKISERTRESGLGSDSDILYHIVGARDNHKATDLMKDVLRKDNPVIDNAAGRKFPLIEMENGNNIQKSLIIGLRDSLRWKTYKFYPERFVDILWTPTQFMVFQIKGDPGRGDDVQVWIEPVALYQNDDTELKNPKTIDPKRIKYPLERWSGKNKASEMNRALKKLEWESFGRTRA